MIKKRIAPLLVLILAVSLVAAACGDDEEAGTLESELVIGYVLPSTGGLAFIIDALVKPIEM